MADKHQRLDSQFSMVCAFWKPDAIDDVHTGTLTVGEGGITFVTAPKYCRQVQKAAIPSLMSVLQNGVVTRLPTLHGFTEDGLCTLFQLTEVEHPGRTDILGQSIVATAYRSTACVMGLHLGGVTDKCLHSAQYTFSGLNDWLPNAVRESWEKEFVLLKSPLNAQEIFSFCLRESHVTVSLKVFPELTNSETDGARLSRSVPYVEIATPEAESFSWYRDIGNRLENFFSLLTGASVALETTFIFRGTDIESRDSGHIIEKRNAHGSRLNPFDCVHCAPSQLANSIAIWLCEPPTFRSIESLALGVVRKSKLFTETEFLSLAQALEGFHRVTTQVTVSDKAFIRQLRRKIAALLTEENVNPSLALRICESMSHANDPTFAFRLTSLCERLGSLLLSRMKIDADQLVSDVVATRNFYTHAGRRPRMGRKASPVEGSKLFFLNQKMRALLRGVMLLHLELPEAQLSELLIREATRWR